MNVIWKEGKLRFEAVNDLEYVLQKIPAEVSHRQSSLPSSTPLMVALELDGLYRRPVTFDQLSEKGLGIIGEVQKTLRTTDTEFSVVSVRAMEVFSVKLALTYEYVLGDCSGKEIVKAIRERMKLLTSYGFVVKKPLLEGEVESPSAND